MRRTNHANGFLGSILSAALALLLSSCMAEPVLTSKGDGLAQGIRHKAPIVNNLSVSADGRRVLTGSFDAFFLWDLQQGKLLQTFTHGKGYMGDTTVVAFAPDGTTFASGGKGIKLWDAATRLQTKVVGEGRTTGLSFSADGKLLLATEYLDRMVLWETASGRMVRAFPWPGVSSSAISPDGRYALSGDRKGWMILWDCATGAELKRVKADHGPTFPPLAEIRSVAFSQDGRRALSGGYDKVAKLWDLPACTEVKTFKGHTGFGGVNAVAFSPDSQFAVTAGFEGKLFNWDLASGQMVSAISGHTGSFGAAGAFALGGKIIVSAGDASTRIWNAATGEEVATLIAFEDGEWIVTTPSGYYNASPKGDQYLDVKVHGQGYSTEQLRESFYRPEVIRVALSGGSLKDLRRIEEVKPPPTIAFIAPPDHIDAGEATLTLGITDNGGGIGDIRLYLNGSAVLLDQSRGLKVLDADPSGLRKSYRLKFSPGLNTLRAIAFNADNTMQSADAVHELRATFGTAAKPTLHALVIGINEYKNPRLQLNFAVADATLFADTLRKCAGPLFADLEVKTLVGRDETTRENLIKELKAMQGLNPDDLFVLYVASHGTVDDGEYFLITSNVGSTRTEHLRTDALGQVTIRELIGNIPATKKLIIIDTCNAGALGEAIQATVLTRGMSEDTAMKILGRAVGSTILSASTSIQEALEGYQGHGLFTFVLTEGLKGKADLGRTGYVKTTELADYVDTEVPTLADRVFKKAQYPTISISGQGFPIGKADE